MVPRSGGFVPRIWAESFAAMRQIVMASDAVGWAPIPLLEPYWRRRELAHLVMKPAPSDIEFGLITQCHRTPAPAVTTFIRIISAIAANKPVPRDLTGTCPSCNRARRHMRLPCPSPDGNPRRAHEFFTQTFSSSNPGRRPHGF